MEIPLTGYVNRACDVDEIMREGQREHKPSFIYINSANHLNVYNSDLQEGPLIDRTPGNYSYSPYNCPACVTTPYPARSEVDTTDAPGPAL